MTTLDFIPADTLFCRDTRPLAAGSGYGHGANWPLPTVLHGAVRTALLRAADALPHGRAQEGHVRKGKPRGHIGTAAFQWLNVQGPFPVDAAGITYFPLPRDLVPAGANGLSRLEIQPNAGVNNLPRPLTALAISPAPPCKDVLAEWVSAEFYGRYLSGDAALAAPHNPDLWDTEHRIGVAIAPETHTALDGQLYAAEHLRLRDGVRLRFRLSAPPEHKPRDPAERNLGADRLVGASLQLGGEQRFGRMEAAAELSLPSVTITGICVKWVLLTPAVFTGGWRPGWVDGETGQVKLRVVEKETRREFRRGRYREGWRYDETRDPAEPIDATLVAACVGKPQVVGGWDLLRERDGDRPKGGKATHLAVPSGSVYYFKAADAEHARRLAAALQGRCRSDFFGEKGLGLGVCGTWEGRLE